MLVHGCRRAQRDHGEHRDRNLPGGRQDPKSGTYRLVMADGHIRESRQRPSAVPSSKPVCRPYRISACIDVTGVSATRQMGKSRSPPARPPYLIEQLTVVNINTRPHGLASQRIAEQAGEHVRRLYRLLVIALLDSRVSRWSSSPRTRTAGATYVSEVRPAAGICMVWSARRLRRRRFGSGGGGGSGGSGGGSSRAMGTRMVMRRGRFRYDRWWRRCGMSSVTCRAHDAAATQGRRWWRVWEGHTDGAIYDVFYAAGPGVPDRYRRFGPSGSEPHRLGWGLALRSWRSGR